MFTDAELEYLRSQRLGRRDLGNTKKFENVASNGKAAFVVDDLASVNPWVVRGFEVRGVGEALTDQELSREVIRIHPRRIISRGLGADGQQGSRRSVRGDG